MMFQIRTYSVLIVSSSEKFAASVKNLLPVTDYWPVSAASSSQEARRMLLEGAYDIVVINAPLKDEFGSKFAADICTNSSSGVLLFVKNEQFEDVCDKVMEYGVLVAAKPASASMIIQSMRSLCSMRERMRKMEEKQITVEEKIEEIRIVNHAKWLLIENEHLSENEAQRFIEKTAMDSRISKRKTAEKIIETYEKPC